MQLFYWQGLFVILFNLHSIFLTLCLFLLGLLITLIGLLAKQPKLCPHGFWILTLTSTRFLFSSVSLIYKCFDTHLPLMAISEQDVGSSEVPDGLIHSNMPAWWFCSLDMPTVILGGLRDDVPESEVGGDWDHQLEPRMIVVGGGHKNLFSVPYDFCATLEVITMTVFSPRLDGLGAFKYAWIIGL